MLAPTLFTIAFGAVLNELIRRVSVIPLELVVWEGKGVILGGSSQFGASLHACLSRLHIGAELLMGWCYRFTGSGTVTGGMQLAGKV